MGKTRSCLTACFEFYIGLFINTIMAIIIYYGAKFVHEKKISVGEITSFLLYMIFLISNFAIISIVVG